MAVAERVKEAIRGAPPVPPDVQKRIDRGRRKMREKFYRRRLCELFLSGEIYDYLLENGRGLGRYPTDLGPNGRPRHRYRQRLNMIAPMVDAKVSGSTNRVPGYEVNPTGTDPRQIAGSRLAEKVIRQGYDRWWLKNARIRAVTTAIGAGGSAYGLPYFDPLVGPFRAVVDGQGQVRMTGEGEIKVMVLSGNQCYGEPGVEWEHSRWFVAEMARPIDEIRQWPDYNGAALQEDATTADRPSDAPDEGMALVTLYFERPCPRYPEGRMLTSCGGRLICPESSYPLRSPEGEVIDEPCIHRLVYKLDPSDDDDLGLTWALIDFQRLYADCMNRVLALKNLALVPQVVAQKGSVRPEDMPTDEPGSVVWFTGAQPPTWRPPPDPALLAQLQAIVARCVDDMKYVAADTEVEAQPNVATSTVQAVVQQAANRWSQFLSHLAEWDSAVARHCLLLAQRHYTEARVLKVRGRYGWEPEATFRGADIMGQVDVTVSPASIETRSRAAQLQTLAWIQANFPGYVRPEVAIEIAMNGESLQSVLESFELDRARANEVIQAIRDGSVMEWPQRTTTRQEGVDPMTGEPITVTELTPGWMPRSFDDVGVQTWVFEQWLKTPDANELPDEMHTVAMTIYDGYRQLAAQQQAQQMAAQSAQAAELGEANAAKPQAPKPMPSTPKPEGQ